MGGPPDCSGGVRRIVVKGQSRLASAHDTHPARGDFRRSKVRGPIQWKPEPQTFLPINMKTFSVRGQHEEKNESLGNVLTTVRSKSSAARGQLMTVSLSSAGGWTPGTPNDVRDTLAHGSGKPSGLDHNKPRAMQRTAETHGGYSQ